MALNIFRQAFVLNRRCLINVGSKHGYSKIYEPDYLETGKSKVPLHPTLNLEITGYSYPPLESFQSFVHKLSKLFNFDIVDSYAFPSKELKVHRFKSRSVSVDAEYHLHIFRRHVIIADLSATQCPLLMRVLEAALPEGVSIKLDTYNPEDEEKRYIPNKQLIDLKTELQDYKRQ